MGSTARAGVLLRLARLEVLVLADVAVLAAPLTGLAEREREATPAAPAAVAATEEDRERVRGPSL